LQASYANAYTFGLEAMNSSGIEFCPLLPFARLTKGAKERTMLRAADINNRRWQPFAREIGKDSRQASLCDR
jgi:hypothetical protein